MSKLRESGRLFCGIVPGLYLFAYLLALLAWGAGMFGWFGVEQDPLSAVGLVFLGQPCGSLD